MSEVSWAGIVAPAHTPDEIVNKLEREIVRIVRMPDIQEKLRLGSSIRSAALRPNSPAPSPRTGSPGRRLPRRRISASSNNSALSERPAHRTARGALRPDKNKQNSRTTKEK